ncbi:E3 ubiquitin-protein ligase LRSAM1 [Octopus bimaculoides]|uniref:RING-type domain-containing protein n=1 Tax=Octopus bimaculoides TaxID=37653 RepID=A0A0L8IDQ0_OCTBM|nr:E3 ubiquitin-protein ligase LRSAM1 [Octopus bimaculoides]XP_014774274.1 E3 ubiquitin-protein ligase LRSAM1 [Octopus bimaculoides]XP_014774279.1 E3 ubiquitin-protein ligase LRSAM1 [Octopus bimaculoides]XP_014774288.1 E3 ubiquitin-protein ligase LRSAM1 [Octopus bimaculoides]XP_014774297.1 E3 ubiquitin-protein ligase LRSAM1 [Octopus bimaculoides]XP_014774306.1 E3 ubiquitin-protein ligase LRSAM1 [Octopus bimaculoides]XP_014774314.1 E3 ubiquitin-protein ligase LRSAM1 [Octopus bimaculoides]|eukprot:XP_014774266.1 PREDICTED: E3 ubiquitin-protein ligase LRSAM1-like [Octopus bimaculoides]
MGQRRSKCAPDHLQNSSSDSDLDTDTGASSSSRKQSKSSLPSPTDKKMSFFRKQSDEAKRRFEYQMHLAEDNPEPIFDISNSQISEIPSNVFSLCKVLNKEILLLHDNWLTSLKAGDCGMSDLVKIRVLDAHNNSIKHLPENIDQVRSLQVLNLEGNKLKKIPESIGNLKFLQSLNLKGNKLKEIPTSLSNLSSLRTLDLSNNQLTNLPTELWKLRALENLLVDAANMVHPPAEVCSQGTEAIMKFLCSESGEEYIPPSQFLLQVLDSSEKKHQMSSTFSDHSVKLLQEDALMMQDIEKYANLQEKKRQERMAFNRQYEEDEKKFAKMAASALKEKDHLVSTIAQEQIKLNEDLAELSNKKELDRQNLVTCLEDIEERTNRLLNDLMQMNEKARKQEELMEAIEKEKDEQDQYYIVRYEEIANLRRKEVLNRMEEILNSSAYLETCRRKHDAEKKHAARNALEKEMNSTVLNDILQSKSAEQDEMVKVLTQQEELQKAAFEALLMQKDSRHSRVSSQIALIEKELAQLTAIEIERKELRIDMEKNILADKRIALTGMLMQLIAERDKREEQLKMRLTEMEEQRLQDQTDYWLVQYQRLMDRKPQALIDQEWLLEIPVLKILEQTGAQDYIPLFARHRITSETLCHMTEDDLKQMGVHELGVRRAIMVRLQEYQSTKKVDMLPPDVCTGEAVRPLPTAPAPEPSPSEENPTSSTQPIVTARGLYTECSICLDRTTNIIFLNCGHVCCCTECSVDLEFCPLCRSNILQKIQVQQQS